MSGIITFSDKFRCGTGVSEEDIKPIDIRIASISTDNAVLCFSSSNEQSEYDGTLTPNYTMELFVTPGYFYLGDREFYAFGEKSTQLAYAKDEGSGIISISLSEFPDGHNPSNSVTGYSSELDGASPIIIRQYPSGDIASLHVPPNFPISSETGINGIIGYTSGEPDYTGIMTIISGEIENWPWYNSPISRFTKTYEYWRDIDYIFPTDSYLHDFDSNKIVFMPDADVSIDSDFIIEYETMNEPFPIGIDFNPLVIYPEDLMVVIACSENIIEEHPEKVTVYSSRSKARDNIVYIGTEVITEENNRMENAEMMFYINRTDMVTASGDVSGFIPSVGNTINISGDIVYDYIAIPSGDITENNMVILNNHRINGHAIIRSSGYLDYISGDIPGAFYISGITDDTGFEYIHYISPTIVKTAIDISILAIAENMASGDIPISLIPDVTESIYAIPNMEINKIEVGTIADWESITETITVVCHDDTYPLFAEGTTHIIVPSGCLSPSSIQLYNATDFMENLYKGNSQYPIFPHAFYTTESQLIGAYYTSGTIGPSDEIMIDYIPDTHIAKLDGRVHYV